MTAASDLGGRPGFGRVVAEVDEPVFHADWERRAFALTLAMGSTGSWTIDGSRFAREDRPESEYLASSYYEIWVAGLERLLVENDLASEAELRSGEPSQLAVPIRRRLEGPEVRETLRRGASTLRATTRPARFAVDDWVRTLSVEPDAHTRLPAYARSTIGRVIAVHGCHVFPDTNAHRLGEQPQWLYTVEFTAVDLFGLGTNERDRISVDLFEPYLAAR